MTRTPKNTLLQIFSTGTAAWGKQGCLLSFGTVACSEVSSLCSLEFCNNTRTY